MTAEGFAALEAEIKHLKTVERPRIIKADRRGAHPRGPLRERRISRGQGAAGHYRGAHGRPRGQALPRRYHRRVEAQGRPGDVRGDRHPDRRGYRRQGEVPDRWRVRGRREKGQDLHHLAASPARCSASARTPSSRCRRRAAASPTRCSRSSSNRPSEPARRHAARPGHPIVRVASARSASSDQLERAARTPGRVLRISLGDRRRVAERAVALPLAVPAKDVGYIFAKSMPRSGHRFLSECLAHYFGPELHYCGFYWPGLLPPDPLQSTPQRGRQDQPLLHAEEPRFRLSRL